MASKISDNKKKLIIICGPTASGKSSLAIDLALRIGGEIINADSMQIYKEIPIVTSSPSTEEKTKIKHFMYNFVPLGEAYSVAKFVSDAKKFINQVSSKGRVPILVGGTGMYINALIDGLNDIPNIPEEIREDARKLLEELGNEKFYKHLCGLDKMVTEKLHQSNSQRLLRAYEVFIHTRKSLFEYHDQESESVLKDYDVKTLLINMDRKKLYERCDLRLHQMIKDGVIDEVKSVKEKHDPDSIKAIGFKEFASFIDGDISLYDAIKKAQQRTRNYAKRQVTWFKNQLANYEELEEASLPKDLKLW